MKFVVVLRLLAKLAMTLVIWVGCEQRDAGLSQSTAATTHICRARVSVAVSGRYACEFSGNFIKRAWANKLLPSVLEGYEPLGGGQAGFKKVALGEASLFEDFLCNSGSEVFDLNARIAACTALKLRASAQADEACNTAYGALDTLCTRTLFATFEPVESTTCAHRVFYSNPDDPHEEACADLLRQDSEEVLVCPSTTPSSDTRGADH